jgi:hypothetical protein
MGASTFLGGVDQGHCDLKSRVHGIFLGVAAYLGFVSAPEAARSLNVEDPK